MYENKITAPGRKLEIKSHHGCREKAKESAARERTEEEKGEDARNRCFGTFLDDDETICGVVNSREYLCRFDGGTYKLGGVGGVSTLPQYRRGGVIRACMTASLKDMYANDFTFAFLYPFSMQYYRKFGFEAGGRCRSQR